MTQIWNIPGKGVNIMLEVYLVRHGQTLWNQERRTQGQIDISLSENGINQAELLSDRLADISFDSIYASDLKRAFQTAEIIAEKHGLKVVPIKEFREINMGVWQGLTWEEIEEKYPDAARVWREKPSLANIPECEGIYNAAERVLKAFRALTEKHKHDNRILIVSHGLVIGVLFCLLHDIHVDNFRLQFGQGNTAVNIIEYDGEKFNSTLINCTKHYD